jgi:hypothetical protein
MRDFWFKNRTIRQCDRQIRVHTIKLEGSLQLLDQVDVERLDRQ